GPGPRLAVAGAATRHRRLVPPPEAAEFGDAMRAACLLGVFVVAKACTLAGRPVPLSVWTPVAYLWQDLLAVLVFGVADYLLRRPRLGWAAYAGVTLYAAVNVPVARALSTPLTWPLLRAARGPLWDSLAVYATGTNAALGALVIS